MLSYSSPAMTGEQNGMKSLVFSKVSQSGAEAVKSHCIMQEEAVCAIAVQLCYVI